ncbi:hypothetical protein OK016_01220 [Vibrio chagasii]|nr:hypothetical protein [Vibrio chagasii]
MNVLHEEGSRRLSPKSIMTTAPCFTLLDQSNTGEQKFVVAEGSLYVTLQVMCA